MAEPVKITEEQYARAYRRAFGIDTTLIDSEARALVKELNEVLNERWRVDRNQVTDGSVYFDIFSCGDNSAEQRHRLARIIAQLLNENDVYVKP